MKFATSVEAPWGVDKDAGRFDSEVVELSLLMPRWQAAALENAARNRGLTTAQMLRRLVGDVLQNPASDRYSND